MNFSGIFDENGISNVTLNSVSVVHHTLTAHQGFRPDFSDDLSFGHGSDAAIIANMELKASDAVVSGTDYQNQIQRQQCQAEEMLKDANSLKHQAMLARTKGDYVCANALQEQYIAKKREADEILENIEADQSLSFKGGLGVKEMKNLNFVSKVNAGKRKIANGNSLIQRAQKATKARDRKIMMANGKQLISEGNRMLSEARRMAK